VTRVEGLERNVRFLWLLIFSPFVQAPCTGEAYYPGPRGQLRSNDGESFASHLSRRTLGESQVATSRASHLPLLDEWEPDPRSSFFGVRARFDKVSRDVVPGGKSMSKE